MKYPWALAVTYVDVENNQFLNLGGVAFRTKRERDANLQRIATTKAETNFVLDIESARGIEDDRYITAKTVAHLIGKPTAVLIAEARASGTDPETARAKTGAGTSTKERE